jgi:hypothetical protein
MPISDSRRQRQQLIGDGDEVLLARDDGAAGEDEEEEEFELELEELFDEVLPRCWSGSAAGRCAAAVCSWRKRETSKGRDMNVKGTGWTASRGLAGSEEVSGEYSETGVMLGVSRLKWEDEADTAMLK